MISILSSSCGNRTRNRISYLTVPSRTETSSVGISWILLLPLRLLFFAGKISGVSCYYHSTISFPKSNLYSAPPELSERKIPAKSAAENASASDSAGTRVCFSLIRFWAQKNRGWENRTPTKGFGDPCHAIWPIPYLKRAYYLYHITGIFVKQIFGNILSVFLIL